MENINAEYTNYWETTMFYQNQELEYDSWQLEEAISGSYDSSSPDRTSTSSVSKNVVSERKRREKLNQKLMALRSLVPNITKLDKASTIKDSISYIQELQEKERRIQAEIMELEAAVRSSDSPAGFNNVDLYSYQELPHVLKPKKIKQTYYDANVSRTHSPIEVLELNVRCMGEKTVVVFIRCSKKTDTIVRLCEVFETLDLKIITANITSSSGFLLKTVFLQADEEEIDMVKAKVETAIAAFNYPQSYINM